MWGMSPFRILLHVVYNTSFEVSSGAHSDGPPQMSSASSGDLQRSTVVEETLMRCIRKLKRSFVNWVILYSITTMMPNKALCTPISGPVFPTSLNTGVIPYE